MFLVNFSQGIPLSIWYDWQNGGTDPTNDGDNYGMVTADLVPKPAYNELHLLTASLKGETFPRRSAMETPPIGSWNSRCRVARRPWRPGPRAMPIRLPCRVGERFIFLHALLREPNSLARATPTWTAGSTYWTWQYLAANYRKQVTGGWIQGDFNHDGVVDFEDLALLAANYRHSLASDVVPDYDGLDAAAIQALSLAGVTVVPEPDTLAMLAVALIGALAYTWRKRR